MKKLIFVCLVLGVVFAKDKAIGIFQNYFDNRERMNESLKPSFDCSKVKEFSVEDQICIVGGQVAPSLIFIDNFFTSYYNIIMQHTPKDKKQEVKNIAKKAMKKRYENYKHNSCNKELSSVSQRLCVIDTIAEAYGFGIKELSQYLLKNNQTLLNKIFSNYAKQITDFDMASQSLNDTLDLLYENKLIDETGKLIVKINSKEQTLNQ